MDHVVFSESKCAKKVDGFVLETPKFRNVFRVSLCTFLDDILFVRGDCCFYERCGIPCEHVLFLTNSFSHEMVKIQHWKVFGSHYNDNSELGMEIKKCQLDSRKYEGMGVPISDSVMKAIRSQNHTCVFPYLYFGASLDDYDEAMYVLDNKQCVTEYECQNQKVDARRENVNITGTKSPFFDMSQDDISDMNCAASPLKGSNLFPEQLNGSQVFTDMFTPIKEGVISANDQSLYLSPTTRDFQRDLQSAGESVNEVYDKHRIKIIRKNLIESIEYDFL